MKKVYLITNFPKDQYSFFIAEKTKFQMNRYITSFISYEAFDRDGKLIEDYYSLWSEHSNARVQYIRFKRNKNIKLKKK